MKDKEVDVLLTRYRSGDKELFNNSLYWVIEVILKISMLSQVIEVVGFSVGKSKESIKFWLVELISCTN